MITIVLYGLIGLFALKILWNLTVPYDLAWKAWRSKGQKIRGISLMPYMEIGLLLLAIGAAALSDGQGWLRNPKNLAVWGGLAVAASYIHLVLAGMVAGWITSQMKEGQK